MTLENRLKATRLAASGQISPANVPCHVVAYHIVSAVAGGTLILNNGGSGGANTMQVDMPPAVAVVTNPLPMQGVRFSLDCYATIPAGITFVTIWWY